MMEPLVLVPGLACTELLFEPVVRALGDKITVQIANHRGPDTVDGIVSQILEAAPPYFALGGLSMGGYIAMEIVLRAPERVDRLALLDTKIRPDTPEEIARRKAMIEVTEKDGVEAAVTQLIPAFLHPDRTDDPVLVDLVRQMARETGDADFIAQERALIGRGAVRDKVGSIKVPTLVVVGDADRLTPPELAQETQAAIPASTLVTIENSGHLSTLEQPEAVAKALAEWLGLPRV